MGTVLSYRFKVQWRVPRGLLEDLVSCPLKLGKPKGPVSGKQEVCGLALVAEPRAVATMAPKAGGDVPLRSPLRLGKCLCGR